MIERYSRPKMAALWSEAEMYRVFNMGIGFCLIVPPDASVIDTVTRTCAASDFTAHVIGEVVADDRQRVILTRQNLVGEGDVFSP